MLHSRSGQNDSDLGVSFTETIQLKRLPAAPREARTVSVSAQTKPETITPVPYESVLFLLAALWVFADSETSTGPQSKRATGRGFGLYWTWSAWRCYGPQCGFALPAGGTATFCGMQLCFALPFLHFARSGSSCVESMCLRINSNALIALHTVKAARYIPAFRVTPSMTVTQFLRR